ncbi:zinc-ribbon domain containing protein [Chloroflexus sp.]|uniref:zinc-ribbon domain containing protein n=1 Tax=Chloroflexus sp. TaxID=1904827 RepID=UPI00262CFAAD|nr:zinc-ribbon domain containing protein [uncultured Chloroflexus sp.]
MSFADKTLTCRDCGMDFVFTAGEQQFYAAKGFTNEPVRCPSCRKARKTQMSAPAERHRVAHTAPVGRERVNYQVTCASCGQETTVPFVPRGTKPVYCSSCFNRMRGSQRSMF